MKNLPALLIFSTLCSASIQADYIPGITCEAKASAFIPTSKTLRNIFAEALPLFELTLNKDLWNGWEVYTGIGYLSVEGRALGCQNKTHLYFVPVTLGVKHFYTLMPSAEVYVGAGVCCSYMNTQDHSPYVHEYNSNFSLGGVLSVGYTYQLQERLSLDIFSEYLCQHFSFSETYKAHYTVRNNLNLSGFKLGFGVDYAF